LWNFLLRYSKIQDMLKIVQAPTLVLAQKAKPITQIDKSAHQLIKQMETTLLHTKDPEGIGLAAPQVGKSLQLFIIKQTPKSPLLVFINPTIESFFDAPTPIQEVIEQSEKTTKAKEKSKITKGVQLEGCLSLYSIWGVVKRNYGVVLSYQDEHGVKHKRKFDGFLATIIQHEYDHLQGILFPKRVLEQQNQLYKAVKDAQGEIEFEEIEI
jgi:peptide deformylase